MSYIGNKSGYRCGALKYEYLSNNIQSVWNDESVSADSIRCIVRVL